MENYLVPKETRISEIIEKISFSPKRFKKLAIHRKEEKELSFFLDELHPYSKGEEPGSITYVKKSNVEFVRNSCIDKFNISFNTDKIIYLNPHYEFKNMTSKWDVLLCKDANIGDTCLVIEDEKEIDTVISSGVVKLNFKNENFKFYSLALMKDQYFLEQLDALTPKGSTIRHSKDLFLKCKIPLVKQDEEWVYEVFKNLILNISYSEKVSLKKLHSIEDTIDKEVNYKDISYNYPTIKKIINEKRIDAGRYSPEVERILKNIKSYKYGNTNLEGMGFDIKRGPNLAKRDLGRSLKSDIPKPNYKLLVYPSDISDNGYILKSVYLGARNPVWFLKNRNILFSAEGTVGKVFIVCDEEMKFTTNFHGIILYPTNEGVSLKKSIFLGMFLHYLRKKGVLDRLSVGAQGGSFAVGYWDILEFPLFQDDIIELIAKEYFSPIHLNPLEFDINEISNAGIFQLNNFRIQCQNMIKIIVDDIKNDKLEGRDKYI